MPNDLAALSGLRVRLKRTIDMIDNYCTTLTVIRVEDGASRAELRCATCGRHRTWLSPQIAEWLLVLVKNFPAVKEEPVVIRDSDYENPEPNSLYRAHLDALRDAGEGQDDIGSEVS